MDKAKMSDDGDGAPLAERHGIATNHEAMPSGELRFRLAAPDGSAYVRTVSTPTGGWQRSHAHHYLVETYIVQSGWIVIAELKKAQGLIALRMLGVGDIHSTKPGTKHNVYMGPSSVTHTIKHGKCGSGADWFTAADLDDLLRELPFDEILADLINQGQAVIKIAALGRK